MMLIGTIVNALAIFMGSLIGVVFSRISDSMKDLLMKGIGLTVIVLGVQMGMQSQQFLIVILSIAIGAAIGEITKLEERFNDLGQKLEEKIGRKSTIAEGFITASLIFCVGAMAVVGAIDSGLRGDHSILFTKALLDGFTAMILTATLGYGVLFSIVPVFLYQGSIAIFASFLTGVLSSEWIELFIHEITAAGGIMILAIGLNLAGITKIKVANLLPGLLVVLLLIPIFVHFQLV